MLLHIKYVCVDLLMTYSDLLMLFKTQPAQTLQPTEGQQWRHIFADCRRIHAARTQWEQEDTGQVACQYALSIPAQMCLWTRKLGHIGATPRMPRWYEALLLYTVVVFL